MAKGQTVNRSALADIFGVALPTVDGWVRQGVPIVQRGGRGRQWEFDTADVAAWLRDKAVSDATGETQADETEITRRTKKAGMLLAELNLAKAKGEVAPVRDFERAQAAVFAQIRANVMNVAQRVVVQLLGETDETIFKAKLRAELALALEAASEADLIMGDDAEEIENDE